MTDVNTVLELFEPICEAAEGVRLMPYDDATGLPVHPAQGNWTIGIGTKLPLSRDEAKVLWKMRASAFLNEMVGIYWFEAIADSPQRQCALLEVSYNSGSIFEWHDLIAAVKAKDWKAAFNAVLNSKAANNPKLHARYERIADTMLTGVIQ